MDQLIGRKPLTRWFIVFLIGLLLLILWVQSQLASAYMPLPYNNDLFALSDSSALRVDNPIPELSQLFTANSEELAGSGGGGGDVPAASPEQPQTSNPAQPDRLIVRTGVLSLVVDDPRASRIAVEQLVAEMTGEGAFVVSSNEKASGGEQPPTVSILIRVPVGRFEEAMNRIAASAKDILVRSTAAQDVTEEYVDLQAQLISMETARDRLLEIMEEAKTTKDLLEIEQQLTDRNAEIDSIKARLQYLEQTASLSSIQIDFHPSVASQTVIPGWHPDDTARQAIERLIQRFQNTIDWWIIFGIADLPWLLFYAVLIFAVVRLGLRWWRRRSPPKPVAE
jgi:hypothetical protein